MAKYSLENLEMENVMEEDGISKRDQNIFLEI